MTNRSLLGVSVILSWLLQSCLPGPMLLIGHDVNRDSSTASGLVSKSGSGQAAYDELNLPGDGEASQARFTGPYSLAVDSRGNVFVAEREPHRIRRISPDGQVTSLPLSDAGRQADAPDPSGAWAGPLAVDSKDNLYVAYRHRIYRIAADGRLSFVAGSPTPGVADGKGASAAFMGVQSLACDPAGHLYVLDRSQTSLDGARIRKVTPDGQVTTYLDSLFLKGLSPSTYPGRGPCLAVDAAGDLYYGDTFVTTHDARQSYFQIARITGPQAYAVYASGEPGGTIPGLVYRFIDAMAVAPDGTVYVADRDSQVIRRVTPAGQVSLAAGTGQAGFADGPSGTARFSHPRGVALDRKGALYIADTENNRIRLLSPGGTVSTLAGSGQPRFVVAPTAAPAPDPYQKALDAGRTAFLERRFETAGMYFQQALTLRPDEEVPKRNLASSLAQLNQMDQALRLYLELDRKGSTVPGLFHDIGLAYSFKGDCDKAGLYYAKAGTTIEYCPFSFEARQHRELGDTDFKAGRYLDAREHYAKALALQPDYIEAKFNLASAHGSLGEHAQAIRIYQEIESVRPAYPQLYQELARAFSYEGKDCARARAYAEKAGLAPFACPLQQSFVIKNPKQQPSD